MKAISARLWPFSMEQWSVGGFISSIKAPAASIQIAVDAGSDEFPETETQLEETAAPALEYASLDVMLDSLWYGQRIAPGSVGQASACVLPQLSEDDPSCVQPTRLLSSWFKSNS
ncbi:hypothetical protein AKJ16_DCAP03854 [Drosera capensis]